MRFQRSRIGVGLIASALACALGAAKAQEAPADDAEATLLRLPPPPAVEALAGARIAPGSIADPSLALPPPPAAETVFLPGDLTPGPAAPPSTAEAPAAAPELAATDAAAASPAADAALAEALKAALDVFQKAEPPKSAFNQKVWREQRAEIIAFYASRQFAPLWIGAQGPTAPAKSAAARLALAADDGLDPDAFRLAPLPPDADAPARAAAELAFARAVVHYGREASGGRLEPARISALITAKPETASAGAILAALAGAADAGAALHAFNPPHKGYRDLAARLAEVRRERPKVAQPRIPPGPALKVGMSDARVPLIRARFGLDSEPPAEPGAPLVYDTRLAALVADFQRANGLGASGVLTARTIAALSGGAPERLESEILVNMERWRWLPRDLGADRIEVNVPEYSLRLYEGGALVHQARVVVGKPASPTPTFSDRMRFVIVNPSWNVPPSILKKEMLPKMAADPDYWTRRGYEVIRRGSSVSIRQPPGERNALGRIKFMFPNQHAVYLHDTPSRALFGAARRAFSHGCVRVDQPFRLAEKVLGAGWSEARVKSLVGAGERSVNLPVALPIHLEYFTAAVDEHGELRLFDDIYGYSRRMKSALGLGG